MPFWHTLFIAVLLFTSCHKKADSAPPELSASPSEINLPAGDASGNLTINGNAQWSISNAASWLQLNNLSGNSGSSTVQLTAGPNETGTSRYVVLAISSSNGQARIVTVTHIAFE